MKRPAVAAGVVVGLLLVNTETALRWFDGWHVIKTRDTFRGKNIPFCCSNESCPLGFWTRELLRTTASTVFSLDCVVCFSYIAYTKLMRGVHQAALSERMDMCVVSRMYKW